MKKQALIIHGGDTYKTYEEYISSLKEFEIDLEYILNTKKWKDNLQSDLGDEFQVYKPQMPNKFNAKYEEWKIWFEKVSALLNDEIILVGHSLGGIFIVKYLSENQITKKIKACFIIAAPFENCDYYDLVDFDLPNDISNFEKQAGKVVFYHSKDDPVVPFVDLNKYKSLLTNAEFKIFDDRQHFNQESFPELVEDIRNIK